MNNINVTNRTNIQRTPLKFEKRKDVIITQELTPSDKLMRISRSNGYLGKFFDKIHGLLNTKLSKKNLSKDLNTGDTKSLEKKFNRYYDQNKNETEIAIDLITGLSAAGIFKLVKKGLTYSHAYTHSKYEKLVLLAGAGVSAIFGMIIKPVLKGINSFGTPKRERKKEKTILKDIGSGFVDGAIAPIGYAHKLGIIAAAGLNSASRYAFNKHEDKKNAFSNHLTDGWLVKIPALAIAGISVFKFHKKIGGIENAIKKAKENIKNIKPFDAKLPLTELADLATSNLRDKVTQNDLIDKVHKGFFSKTYRILTTPLRAILPKKALLGDFIPKPLFRTVVESPELIKEKEMTNIMRELEQYNIFYPKMIQSMPSNIDSLIRLAVGSDKNISETVKNLFGKKDLPWYKRIFVKKAEYLADKGLKGINEFLNNYKSKCPASRNGAEAQKFIEQTYGDRFKILGDTPLGVGTIAETFLAKDTKTNKEVVIKMLKKWTSAEKLKADRDKMLKSLERIKNKLNDDDYNYQVKLVNQLYDAWSKEVDLKLEAEAAKTLGKYAVNYNTVEPIAVKNNIFVMEKAKGIQFDQFTKWLQKNNKKLTQDEVANLARQYFQVFFEQLLSVPKKGQKVLHADPHAGNIFIDLSNKEKPFTFIDTGNVMRFTPEEAIQNVTSHLDYLIGNSKNIAARLVKGATLPVGMTEKQAAEMLSKHLDETFFSGKNKLVGINSDPFSAVNNESIEFMKKNKVILNSRNTNLLKAEITYFANLISIADIEKSIDKASTIDVKAQEESTKLMLRQIGNSIQNGILNNQGVTLREVNSRLKYIDENPEKFFTTLFSYIPPKAG